MAYKQLPIREVAVDKLRLDLKNYRIPVAPDDEAAALNYLFASEDVLGQIKLLLRDGYFDNEVPVVVLEEGEYVVLEGNRRVSALKAIKKPSVAPSHLAQIEDLRTRYAAELVNMPNRIRVIVVPDRVWARKHVSRLHTGLTKRAWTLDQQANYYYSLLGQGVSVSDLKIQYPDVSVVRFMRMAAMRRFLSGVKFKDKALRSYVVSDSLKMSSFEYAYRNGAIAAAIGVKFDADGRIEPARKKPENIGAALRPEVLEGIEYLMKAFQTGSLNTRSPEFKAGTDEQTVLIAKLVGMPEVGGADDLDDSADGESGSGAGGSESGTGSEGRGSDGDTTSGNGSGPGSGAGGRGPNNPDSLRGLSVSGLPFQHIPSNLTKRILELRAINVAKTPAAAAMLLRSVLEATIKWHFDGSTPTVSGMLNEVFPHVAKAYGGQRAYRDSINAITSGAVTRPGSIKWFNAAAHNPGLAVTEGDVRAAYSLIQPVLIRLMKPS